MTVHKLVGWHSVGVPAVHHLYRAHAWTPDALDKLPLCGGGTDALVYRIDGLYCRRCIGLEGVDLDA